MANRESMLQKSSSYWSTSGRRSGVVPRPLEGKSLQLLHQNYCSDLSSDLLTKKPDWLGTRPSRQRTPNLLSSKVCGA
jgi:hypothetical protein